MKKCFLVLAPLIVGCGGKFAPEEATVGVEGEAVPIDAEVEATSIAAADGNLSAEVVTSSPRSESTSEKACDAIADAMCSAGTRACCSASSLPWDEVGCRTRAKADCDALVTRVAAGERTFDASKLAPCLAGWTNITKACTPSKVDVVDTLIACAAMFPATSPMTTCDPAKCSVDADCAWASGTVAFCGGGRCHWYRSPSSHATRVAGPSTCALICIDGESACDGPSAHVGVARCAPTKGAGDPCGWPIDGCCGQGLHCDAAKPSAGICVPSTLADGAACSTDDCISGDCNAGRCEPMPMNSPMSKTTTVADVSLCSGGPGSWLNRL